MLSQRINKIQASPIRKLYPYAEEALNRGIVVYPLNIGQPDIKTPEEYLSAICNFDEEVISYANSKGIPQLINSFVKYYNNYEINFNSDDIIITNGGSEALLFTMLTLCDVGDEILIPEPYYSNYNSLAHIAGINIVPITTNAESGFSLPEKSAILNLVTSKTKAILITNPSNPTGKVYLKDEINLIREIALEKNLFIIADEVYKEFVYDGLEYISFAHFKDIEDRVIIPDSISKRYSACGARIGCIASKNKEIMKSMLKLAQSRLAVATLEQVGAANLINVPDSYMEEVKTEYCNRRDLVFNALQEMDGVICKKPSGAFYIVAKLPVVDAEKFAIWLLREFNVDNETILITPAENFYATDGLGRDEIRISYSINIESLKKAMNILKEALKVYPNKK
ncbi:pyridoxal phosphate-dependent aminotransferase [Tissierella sp. Yu-01]|uniref:pyridoxal phosphate-dependent aminotransferase n=1 Tax=Tissierella sp. Yu-01 TaxID=3035694 RepID=UPI00240D3A35|nr:pyridoxal phosphate-dependent aminotransferase [Tissierella sp. Yu-01]WFA09136.1 pyridoxal phosphate-dependent aminotransferase [Tissierella sp. Yu-01]